jgi:quercetin dioxygenase-like cupin family protein
LTTTQKPDYSINRVTVIAKSSDVQVREMEVGGDQEVPWHFHTAMRDHCYCLQGKIAVETLGADRKPNTPVVLGIGERCVIDAGTPHRITCASPPLATYLLVQDGGRYDFNLLKSEGSK